MVLPTETEPVVHATEIVERLVPTAMGATE
jgi:hypothetical protein